MNIAASNASHLLPNFSSLSGYSTENKISKIANTTSQSSLAKMTGEGKLQITTEPKKIIEALLSGESIASNIRKLIAQAEVSNIIGNETSINTSTGESPQGVFNNFGSTAFSDFVNKTIGGTYNFIISQLQSITNTLRILARNPAEVIDSISTDSFAVAGQGTISKQEAISRLNNAVQENGELVAALQSLESVTQSMNEEKKTKNERSDTQNELAKKVTASPPKGNGQAASGGSPS